LALIAFILWPHGIVPYVVLLCGTFLVLALSMTRRSRPLWRAGGVLYLGIPSLAILTLRDLPPHGGWLIGVLVEIAGEPKPLLHYFAVGHLDQGKCEWTAVDLASQAGRIASSPVGGQEPVEVIRPLTRG